MGKPKNFGRVIWHALKEKLGRQIASEKLGIAYGSASTTVPTKIDSLEWIITALDLAGWYLIVLPKESKEAHLEVILENSYKLKSLIDADLETIDGDILAYLADSLKKLEVI